MAGITLAGRPVHLVARKDPLGVGAVPLDIRIHTLNHFFVDVGGPFVLFDLLQNGRFVLVSNQNMRMVRLSMYRYSRREQDDSHPVRESHRGLHGGRAR